MVVTALAAELAQLEARDSMRTRRVLRGAQGPYVNVEGRDYLAFCSNDYLGLAADSRISRSVAEGCLRYGIGAGASHLVLGHNAAHHDLEQALARFVGLPRALLFSTGYMANMGALAALVGRGDAVFGDRLNHASLVDAALLSRATFKRYPHGDVGALERLLARTRARRRLIATDAVFSMEGDIAPIPALLQLADRYDAWLLVDDAHGFGVLGEHGRGILSHFGIRAERIVYMATLGKAAGVFGAFVAGEDALIETLIQRARAYVYTTATPPLLAHGLLMSLQLIESEQWRRDHLSDLIAIAKKGFEGQRWRVIPSDTPIQPLVVGANAEALSLAAHLAERGVLVPAIRPPTVPHGTARLRISLSAAHTADHVKRLIAALHEFGSPA